jgi:hypothetical protein
MMLKRVAVLGMLVAATVCWAQVNPKEVPVGEEEVPGQVPGADGLIPRKAIPKRPIVMKPKGPSRLMVKFRDDLRIRPTPGGDSKVLSRSNADTAPIEAIAQQFGVEFISAFTTATEEKMSALEARAAAHSRKAQPDLAGTMYVVGPEEALMPAANALHALDLTEFVYFQEQWKPYGAGGVGACCLGSGAGGTPPDTVVCADGISEDVCDEVGGVFQGVGTVCGGVPATCVGMGACCIADDTCIPLTETQCTLVQGSFKGVGSNCILDEINCENTGCGDPLNGSCFEEHLNPFCDDEECCEAVGDIDPFCVLEPEDGGTWDIICVWLAHGICDPAIGADRCLNAFAGNCFEFHLNPGCADSVCCSLVCGLDTFCCEEFWDENCVALANEACVNPSANGPTPNFVALQGYLRSSSYDNQLGGAPAGLLPPAPTANGFTGEGLDLFSSLLLEDDESALDIPERFDGLYGVGRELNEVYNVGNENRARGKGIKVAVIEWAWFGEESYTDTNNNGVYNNGEPFTDWNHNGVHDTGHEDLDVINEPGQSMIMIDDVTGPGHATACLGIINAKANGFGVTGIAPDAQAYFFPLTSVEEGPREMAAFLSCYNTLGPGDVVSCSFGPGGNLNNEEGAWMLMRLGSDLGITTCVSAGNDCQNLDDVQDLGFSGAIVVGACTPGRDFCRLTFSNHFEEGSSADPRSNNVNIAAWGSNIVTTGHDGNLFLPDGDFNRSYTNGFNGTSGACPIIAGAVACLSGLAQQFYEIPLEPGKYSAALRFDAWAQCGVSIPDNLPGFDDAFGCGPDVDPDEPPKKIGPFPDLRRGAAFILSQQSAGFGDSPLIKDFLVIRGDLLFGNKFSLMGSDNNYLVLQSEYTFAKHDPDIAGPAGDVKYLGTGQTSDIMIIAQSDQKTATSMGLQVEQWAPEVTSFLIIEMYDWLSNEWSFVAIDTPAPGSENGPAQNVPVYPIGAAQRFIEPNSKKVLIRLYVFGLGAEADFSGDMESTEWLNRYDWINLTLSNGFGGGIFDPGDGGPNGGPETE